VAVLSACGIATAASKEGGVSATPASSAAPIAPGKQIFPVQGRHEYWDGFGAGRGHEGVDIGARCGTPLVAVQAGRLRYSKYHPRAGNYAVIDLKGTSIDLAYMHMQQPATARAGQALSAGQPIGTVGDTGNASGCHLHFEVWEGAYYGGGSPVDPMPFLTAWHGADRHRSHRRR
jgi:murein DD-endopeptidase MepM/ murein hydrolase activator NlpD